MADAPMILFQNASLLDPDRGELLFERSVLVEGDRIREVGGAELKAIGAQSIDVHGRTLMPGLIDAHVVEGDPLRGISVLTHPARNLRLLMTRGRIARDELER